TTVWPFTVNFAAVMSDAESTTTLSGVGPGVPTSCLLSSGYSPMLVTACAMFSTFPAGKYIQQRLGFLQVHRIKPLGEPAVDGRQQLSGFSALTLLLPQPAQAHGRPQLQRFRLLLAGDAEGLAKTYFRLLCVRDGLLQQ